MLAGQHLLRWAWCVLLRLRAHSAVWRPHSDMVWACAPPLPLALPTPALTFPQLFALSPHALRAASIQSIDIHSGSDAP